MTTIIAEDLRDDWRLPDQLQVMFSQALSLGMLSNIYNYPNMCCSFVLM